jgi:hypothetical protein
LWSTVNRLGKYCVRSVLCRSGDSWQGIEASR